MADADPSKPPSAELAAMRALFDAQHRASRLDKEKTLT